MINNTLGLENQAGCEIYEKYGKRAQKQQNNTLYLYKCMYAYNIYTEAGRLEENDCTLHLVSLFVMKEGVFILF